MVVRTLAPVRSRRPRAGTLCFVPFEVTAPPAPRTAERPAQARPIGMWNALACVTFVVMLATGIGFPVIRILLEGSPAPLRWSHRPLPVASVTSLPPAPPMPRRARPASQEPAGGIAFVRCTSLWSARPDGSGARRILAMKGISSPVFSPTGRTIAFLRNGREIWMAAADGSRPTRVAELPLADLGTPVTASNLTWSGGGDKLAFALVDATADRWSGGSALWMLDLATGRLRRVASGWPVPSFQGERLFYADRYVRGGSGLVSTGRRQSSPQRLSNRGDALAAGFRTGSWSGIYRRGVAILRRDRAGALVLAIRHFDYSRGDAVVVKAPNGYSFLDSSGPVVAQDDRTVYVDLLDHKGELDLGVLDTARAEWNVVDYAWDAAATPAPVVIGSVAARRARWTASDLIGSLGRRPAKVSMLAGSVPAHLVPFRGQSILGDPLRQGSGWRVPALVFGKHQGRFSYRKLHVDVSGANGRIRVRPLAASSVTPVDTLHDAARVLDDILPVDVVVPPSLPQGAVVSEDYALSGWSWDGGTTAAINLVVPKQHAAAGGPQRTHSLSFTYGDEIGFNLGCGAENDPQEIEVGGSAGLIDRLGRTTQVIWPATLKDRSEASYSVHGDLPKQDILDIARSLASSTP